MENYFVAAGMNSRGVAMAGGVGRAMAEWVVNGETAGELWPFDVRRFTDLHNNRKFLRDRVKETLGTWGSGGTGGRGGGGHVAGDV